MRTKLLVSFLIVFVPYGLLHAAAAPAVKEYKKANKLFAASNYQEAIPLYQKVLAAPPDDVAVSAIYTKIADSYYQLGHYKNALSAYRGALREQKRSERPQTQYWIGFCCFLLGRDAEAVAEFLKIPELYPGSGMWVGTAYYWAGRASERMGKKELAAEYYRKAGGNGKSTQGRFAVKRAEAVKKTSTKLQAPNPK
ncbi:MAG: tetratricopeptide repeat protein [Nitrospirota bacterium]